MSRWKLVGVAALAAAAAVAAACEKVPLTAAPGSSLTLIANPTFVPANGGRSLVTAILVEPAGTFVPDGTEVFFFTNLGQVQESGKTVNGVARVYFVADSRSGTATVTAISGGPAPAPSASASPGTGGGASGSSSGTGNDTVDIAVGSALPARVVVTADPQRITSSRQSSIVATVYDEFGNPVQNVPVSFSLSGTLIEETLDSGGAPRFTDSSGQAFDTLRTRAPVGGAQKSVTVTATLPVAVGGANAAAPSVTVYIN
jgi:hypothetical protein